MLTDSTDDTSLQERYDMLKVLCRQQILVNETLKSEISKLRNLVRKVSIERTLLLDELLENHSSCRTSSKMDSKADVKLKPNSQVSEKRPNPHMDDRSFIDAKKAKSHPWNDENLDGREEYLNSNLAMDTSISHDSSHFSSSKSRLHLQVTQRQTSPSVNKSSSSLINSIDEKPRHFTTNSNYHSNQSGSSSPPSIPTSTRLPQSPIQNTDSLTQKPSKLGSLVTNSSVASNTSSTPFNLSQRNTSLNQTKYVSVANRSVKFMSSGIASSMGRIDQSTGGMLKAAISPPISPNIRLSTSGASNQRIMIQPSKGAVRSIIVPRTQHSISDPPLEYGYTG